MGLQFVGASTQYLKCSNPCITDYPFSVGCWVKLSAVSNVIRTIFNLSDTATDTENIRVQMAANETFGIAVTNTASGNTAVNVTDPILAGVWAFVLGRFLTSTNRRLSVFTPRVTTVYSATSAAGARVVAGLDTMTLGALIGSSGASTPWDGAIAEYWLAKGDVFSTDTNATASFMQALALGGPFSMPNIQVIDYMSLQGGFPGRERFNPYNHLWQAFNGPLQISDHPPLPYWYKRSNQIKKFLVI